MLKEKKILRQPRLSGSQIVKKNFLINKDQENKIKEYIDELKIFNEHTNLVGKSTLVDPWRSHILDCLQLMHFIKNKSSPILDMGSGAGLPGLVLAIMGYNKITLIDSNGKKTAFLKQVSNKLKINVKILLERIENLKSKNYNFLISRALSNLNNLLTYSQNIANKDTSMIFLKGKLVNYEIVEAKKYWKFDHKIYESLSDKRGSVLIISNLRIK